MVTVRHILNRLVGAWRLRAELVSQPISARDSDWFARCRIKQFTRVPWLVSDALRGLCAIALLLSAPDKVLYASALLVCGLWLGEGLLRRTMAVPLANAERRLRQLGAFLIVRAGAWSILVLMMVLHAGPRIGMVIFFSLGALLFDIMLMLSLPVVGVLAGSLLVIALAGGIVLSTQADQVLLTVLAVASILGLQHMHFSLYHLFTTSQIRARRLATANGTIQALISQYDQHGADARVDLDRTGRLVRPSVRLSELLGRSPADLAGTPIGDLFEPGAERDAIVGAVCHQHQFRELLVPLRARGERRWWSVSGCAVFDSEGHAEGFRCFAHDITEQRANEERIRIMAMRDNLTGLVNRAVFTDRLAHALADCSDAAQSSVLFIDLDCFKLVNDTYGHAAGDTVLIEAARRIEELLGPDMLAARLGGDEFAVLTRNVSGADDVVALGKAIVAALTRPVVRDEAILPCGASVGIAIAPEHGRTGETVLRAADIALYEAKSRGRGTSVLFHPRLLHEVQEQRELEMDLRGALERGELEVWYQPLLDIASRRTVGYEALLRWHHPRRGTVEPCVFIPLAEEAGLIGPIGEWVLREALAEAAGWQDDLTIAVNVSPAQMRGDALLGQVVGALATSGVAPARLELEITETLLMEASDMHLRTLHRLRALGVRIALDDFGTGYSSLNYLRQFPFDKLKVDRSFVSDIDDEPESRAIVETVLGLARKFSMMTTAEGIESEAQLARLVAMGCSQAQGFLFAKPLAPGQIPIAHRKAPAALPSPERARAAQSQQVLSA